MSHDIIVHWMFVLFVGGHMPVLRQSSISSVCIAKLVTCCSGILLFSCCHALSYLILSYALAMFNAGSSQYLDKLLITNKKHFFDWMPTDGTTVEPATRLNSHRWQTCCWLGSSFLLQRQTVVHWHWLRRTLLTLMSFKYNSFLGIQEVFLVCFYWLQWPISGLFD